jgi:steroid Delta-isomerase
MSEAGIARYCEWFETLSPDSLDSIDSVFTPDARFADPFSDVRGQQQIARIFTHMFERAPDSRFVVRERAFSGSTWFLYWNMTFTSSSGKPWSIEGTSRITLATDGRVAEHVDYWDAGKQFYEHLPILGPVLRLVRRRLG